MKPDLVINVIEVLKTVAPIFLIIFLGTYLRSRGFFQDEFVREANRLAFYAAIPALLFREVATSSLAANMQPVVVLTTFGAVIMITVIVALLARVAHVPPRHAGSFIQVAFHGNVGYVGWPWPITFSATAAWGWRLFWSGS